MAINFDSLPNNKPNAVPEKGAYFAVIEKAEMKQPKDPAKPKYLNLMYALKTKEGKSAGKLFDLIAESDHELMRYKLKKFIEALELNLSSFELKDLCKIVTGKSFIVDITKEEKEGQAPKAVVDLFTNEIYYPMSEASKIFGISTTSDDNSLVINEPDAADASEETDDEEY